MEIRPENRKRFEQQGVRVTQHHLQMGSMGPRQQNEAIEWLAEEERKTKRRDTKRYGWMLFFAIVAAVGAAIAAIPIVKGWIN